MKHSKPITATIDRTHQMPQHQTDHRPRAPHTHQGAQIPPSSKVLPAHPPERAAPLSIYRRKSGIFFGVCFFLTVVGDAA
jgi:hypothetical protein